MPPLRNKGPSKLANQVQQLEDHLHDQNEKRSKKIIDDATEFYDEIVKDYSEAKHAVGEQKAKCEARFAQLVADLARQDAIKAAAYKALDGYSAETERVMAMEIESVVADLDRSVKGAKAAQAGIKKAQELERSSLDRVKPSMSVYT